MTWRHPRNFRAIPTPCSPSTTRDGGPPHRCSQRGAPSARAARGGAAGDLTLVTQNVDDLHERAGTRALMHMHGELRLARRTACGARTPCDDDLLARPPCGVCGQRRLRPDVVWFGEVPYGLDGIEAAVASSDVFVSIGTSGEVYPAAGYVALAAACGARAVELNLVPSSPIVPFDRVHAGLATAIVPQWVDEVLAAR